VPLFHRTLSFLLLLPLLYQPLWLRVWAWQRLRSLQLLEPADDERILVVVGSSLVHAFAYVSANLCVAAAYWWQPGWLQPFRVQPQRPWPWQLQGDEREAYRRLLLRSMPMVGANLMLLTPALLWLAVPLQRWAGLQCDADADSMPTWRTSAAQMAVMVVVEDTIFYVRAFAKAAATATAAATASMCVGGGQGRAWPCDRSRLSAHAVPHRVPADSSDALLLLVSLDCFCLTAAAAIAAFWLLCRFRSVSGRTVCCTRLSCIPSTACITSTAIRSELLRNTRTHSSSCSNSSSATVSRALTDRGGQTIATD
jgi:hypothetical protein